MVRLSDLLDESFDNCFGCGEVPYDILEELDMDNTELRPVNVQDDERDTE